MFCTVHFDVLRKCDKQTNKHQYNHAGQSFFAPFHPLTPSTTISREIENASKKVTTRKHFFFFFCVIQGEMHVSLHLTYLYSFHFIWAAASKRNFFFVRFFSFRDEKEIVCGSRLQRVHTKPEKRERDRGTHEYVRALFYKKGYMRVCALHKQLDSI